MLKAIGFNLREEDKSLIKKMIDKVLLTSEYQVYDLRSIEIQVDSNDDILIFGDKALRLITPKLNSSNRSLGLPDISELAHGTGNEILRECSYENLLKFKIELDKPRAKSIPPKNPVQVLTKEQISKIETKEYLIILEDGRKVRIIDMSTSKENEVDIEITIEELRNLQLAVSVLQAKEMMIVSSIKKEQRQ